MMKKRTLTPEECRESDKLKHLYNLKKKDLDLNHEKLGDLIGISQSAVSHYMNQVNALNLSVALKFAKALNVSIEEFSHRLAAQLAEIREEAGNSIGDPVAGYKMESREKYSAEAISVAKKITTMQMEGSLSKKLLKSIDAILDETRKSYSNVPVSPSKEKQNKVNQGLRNLIDDESAEF